jgi:hypothetical protein
MTGTLVSFTSSAPAIMPAALETFVEAEDAALFVRISPRHLKKLAREGRIPAHPRGDGQRRRWLFLLSELDEWMRRRVNSNSDPCREPRSIQ